MKDTEKEPKRGTYKNQWLYATQQNLLFMKRDPETAFPPRVWNSHYFLWDDRDSKNPAEVIQLRFEGHVDRRAFYPEKEAGIINIRGERVFNVPVTRAERLQENYEMQQAEQLNEAA